MNNELTRAYRQASTQVRVTAERNAVALTGRDVDKVVRSYGFSRNPSSVTGDSIVNAHSYLERMSRDVDNGELLVRCQRQAEISYRASISHATVDDVERLQRFARMHNHTDLTSTQAEAILGAHKDLLHQTSDKIGAAVNGYQARNNINYIGRRVGVIGKNVGRGLAVAVSMSQASNSEDGSGIDAKSYLSQGYDVANDARKHLTRQSAAERKLGDDWIKNNPRNTSRNKPTASPRKNKTVGATGRNANRVTKSRAAFAKAKVQREAHVITAAERSSKLRRGSAVSSLVAKKKAKDAASQGAKESVKSAVSKWAGKSSAAVYGKFFLALFLACFLVTIVFIVCLIFILIFTETYASRNALIGDWYDNNTYKTSNFVEITQDLQRKYYDDCLMLAYEVGADTPKPAMCDINWKEVYSLWAAIVRYRAGNAKMQEVYQDADNNDVTGYSVGAPVFDFGYEDENRAMFTSGDDYLQDFYLAFYSMYYDLKALDYHGNPLVYDVVANETYYPYYPEITTGTGFDYSYFCEANGYPLYSPKSSTLIMTTAESKLLYKENGQWKINTHDRYYFLYAYTGPNGGTDSDSGINRGRPKVTFTYTDKEDKFERPVPDATIYYDIEWQGNTSQKLKNTTYQIDFPSSTSPYESCYECGGQWVLKKVWMESGDGKMHEVKGSDRHNVVSANLSFKIYNSKVSYVTNSCGWCQGTSRLPSGMTQPHNHLIQRVKVGTYPDLYWKPEPKVVKYQDVTLNYPDPTALDGLKALHDVYYETFMEGYYNGGRYSAYGQGKPFFLGGHHVVGSDIAVEMGTLYYSTDGVNQSNKHENILVVLDQIFDRREYYPWAAWGFYPRWKHNETSSIYAFGLPGAKGGVMDCYDSIVADLNNIRASSSSSYAGYLPADSYLHAYFDTGSNEHINPYAVNNRNPEKEKYTSVVEVMGKSVADVRYCFPFRVRYKPEIGWEVGGHEAGSAWEQDTLHGEIDDAFDVLFFTTGKAKVIWNSTTYLMYRYLMAEQHMCPAAACGVLGALVYETNFSEYGYKDYSQPDNNGAYALGLLQWNEGVEWSSDHLNLYNNTLCSWCAERNMNWRNTGAQLKFLDSCCAFGGPAGNYPAGVYRCQMLPYTYEGHIGDVCYESGYTDWAGMPTFSRADCAATYEACFWWGVYIEIGVEQRGGTYRVGAEASNPIMRPGYAYSSDPYNIDLIYDLEEFVPYYLDHPSDKVYEDRKLNVNKQRMVSAHCYLRYIAASDPAYYSVMYYEITD